MDVGHDDLVLALIGRLDLAQAQRHRVGVAVGEELVAAALDNLCDALV